MQWSNDWMNQNSFPSRMKKVRRKFHTLYIIQHYIEEPNNRKKTDIWKNRTWCKGVKRIENDRLSLQSMKMPHLLINRKIAYLHLFFMLRHPPIIKMEESIPSPKIKIHKQSPLSYRKLAGMYVSHLNYSRKVCFYHV